MRKMTETFLKAAYAGDLRTRPRLRGNPTLPDCSGPSHMPNRSMPPIISKRWVIWELPRKISIPLFREKILRSRKCIRPMMRLPNYRKKRRQSVPFIMQLKLKKFTPRCIPKQSRQPLKAEISVRVIFIYVPYADIPSKRRRRTVVLYAMPPKINSGSFNAFSLKGVLYGKICLYRMRLCI